jgi:glycosyltransferase involved in cell wall biosynthesis
MIEAMACGTPVIAWRCGSVPEIVGEGVTGFIIDSIDDGVAAVKSVGAIDRRAVRAEFERRFTADRMAQDYVALYQELAGHAPSPAVALEEPHETHIG